MISKTPYPINHDISPINGMLEWVSVNAMWVDISICFRPQSIDNCPDDTPHKNRYTPYTAQAHLGQCIPVGQHSKLCVSNSTSYYVHCIPPQTMYVIISRTIQWVSHRLCLRCTWWRHQIKTFSALLAHCEGNPPVTGGFLSQRPMTRSFDGFFDMRLNKRLRKHSRSRCFETPSRRTGDKTLSELMMTECTDAYMCTCNARSRLIHSYKLYPLTTRGAYIRHTFISRVCLSRYMLNPDKLLRFTSVQYLGNDMLSTSMKLAESSAKFHCNVPPALSCQC